VNTERIKEIIDKIPINILLLGYLLYLGYDYYMFESDVSSQKVAKAKALEAAKASNAKLEKRAKELSEFVRSLETKKVEIRNLAQNLQGMKATLSESTDDAAFIKIMYTEAKKAGLTVLALRPGASVAKEYYVEKSFVLSFGGVFAQVYSFLDRISNVAQIVRVENFAMKPSTVVGGKFVVLEGEMELKTYKYQKSKADSLGQMDAPARVNDPKSPGGPGKPLLKVGGIQ